MIVKSDQESTNKALSAAAKPEKDGACELLAEESPVGEHQSNGGVKNSIKTLQRQARTTRLVLQSRYRSKIDQTI